MHGTPASGAGMNRRSRSDQCAGLRRQRGQGFFTGLDRGEIIDGRIVQNMGLGVVRVVVGPSVIWARTTGATPSLGTFRFEVVTPGRRPVLRLIEKRRGRRLDLVVDPSRDKAQSKAGRTFDRRI